MHESKLALKAPLTGPIVPLGDVPDPVFAQKMVGDGISIDPITPTLVAPCDGKVVQLHRACHAVTIEAENGLEVMMHIGLDTVALEGTGFTAHVALGDNVKTGDRLIDFDADYVATTAKSLLTQVIITNSDRVSAFEYGSGHAVAGEDDILTLTVESITENAEDNGHEHNDNYDEISSDEIVVPNLTGLHARPAAVLVGEAKTFSATIELAKGAHRINAKSLVSIMSLEVNHADPVRLIARGTDAADAISRLASMIAEGLGEKCPPIDPAAIQEIIEAKPEPLRRSSIPNLLLGVTASPGLAIGDVFQLTQADIDVEALAPGSTEQEYEQLQNAIREAIAQLKAIEDSVDDNDKAAIFAAHQELLSDPELIEDTNALIIKGKSAAFAWKHAYINMAAQLGALKNTLLAERANDVRDVGRRVLQIMLGLDTKAPALPSNAILIAEDLTPSDTANLDREKVLGFCTLTGGASSHVAILARAMNIPAIAGIEKDALTIANGTRVILDASKGSLKLEPSQAEVDEIHQKQQALAKKRERDIANASLPAKTVDRYRVEVVANVANAEDSQEGVALGSEGVGLLRSEFLFMDRTTAPTEEEQYEAYSSVAKTLDPKHKLIIRTLDVGGDKPLSYLPIVEEENPFLGLRGVRVMLQRTEMFRVQLRAILRTAEHGNVHIMFPMITTIEDLRSAKALLEEERAELGLKPIPVGIMVEVPTTAVMAEQFAKEVDFFSVGTNDLTQYTLAIDRGHPQLAAQADGLNPGVLKLIASTTRGAAKHKKWVGVCGGIACEAEAIPILIGLGVTELSVSVPSVPAVKAHIRELSIHQCKALAKEVIGLDSAKAVRQAAAKFLATQKKNLTEIA